MALTTYSDLQTAVANWIARTDLTSYIPDFVVLFEAHVNRTLRVRRMETTTTLTPDSSGEATVPSDFLEFIRLTWQGSQTRELEYVTPSYLQYFNATGSQDTPQVFTIEGSTLKVTPLSTTNVELVYYQQVPALASNANWLFSQHPDVYLFGTLVEANVFIKNPEAASLWQQRRDAVLADIISLDMAAKGPSAIRPMGIPTP